MNSKIYRCGWCGHPTDSTGTQLTGEAFNKAWKIIETYGDNHHTHLEHGDCCAQEHMEPQKMRVTRDMAIDAGDLSLEGEWI